MAYRELIKSFSRIRAYMRSFYAYGFKHRGDCDEKSARGYDNERRRIESWLGDYMRFGQDADGRRVFLSVDSRAMPENPLYRAFRTKSFTDRDIMLHFQLLDILPEQDGMASFEIMEEISERLNAFDEGDAPDESTETLVFELEDTRNALMRVLLHFSHLEKETKRLDERRYRVTLRYDRADETEMVIRVLSFGSIIRVLEPTRFIELLRERIERQRTLAAFLLGNETCPVVDSQPERM